MSNRAHVERRDSRSPSQGAVASGSDPPVMPSPTRGGSAITRTCDMKTTAKASSIAFIVSSKGWTDFDLEPGQLEVYCTPLSAQLSPLETDRYNGQDHAKVWAREKWSGLRDRLKTVGHEREGQ
jgi:hypothetical protein